jgi:hypothetical protein
LRPGVERSAARRYQAIGPKRNVLRYTMQLEYHKQLSIVGMAQKN